MDYYTVFVISAIVIGVTLYEYNRKRVSSKNNERKLIDQWGRGDYLKYHEGELENISSYFRNKGTRDFFIDDITWNDLEMDEIFKKLNHTISSVGEEYLYYLLRTPVFNEDVLLNRHKQMQRYEEDVNYRLSLQKNLQKLKKRREISVSDIIYSSLEKYQGIPLIFIRILSLLSVLSPFLLFIKPEIGIMVFFTLYPLNMWIHYSARKQIDKSITSIRYIINLINISQKCIPYINSSATQEQLRTLYKKLKVLNSLQFKFLYPSNTTEDIFGAIFDYLRIVTLVDLFMYNKLIRIIDEKKGYIKEIYEILGEIDAMISLASYRAGLEEYCLPVFSKGKDELLEFENSYHPLLQKPVKNSLYHSNSILITGANASGKSTFLKTIGINQIFAQSFYTALARKYETKMVKVYSAMSVKDNIVQNESYYIAEIKAVKRIIDEVKKEDYTVLCIVDELLKGTNTKERIVGAFQILSYLLKRSFVYCATHDIELTELLKEKMDNYHFQSEILDNEIKFDYLIKEGKSMDTNAIELLRVFNFDEEIIVKSKEMLQYI